MGRIRGYTNELERLKRSGKASFLIPPPARNSTMVENRFAPFCKVRVSRMRCWVDGVTTNDDVVLVEMKHMGTEVIRGADRSLVPFVHDQIAGALKYNWKMTRWDKRHRYVENPDEVIEYESDMGIIKYEGDSTEYLKMFGPFGEWEITLSTDDNDGLDRLNIKAIHMDFHIVAEKA
jgi:hypothetical protein